MNVSNVAGRSLEEMTLQIRILPLLLIDGNTIFSCLIGFFWLLPYILHQFVALDGGFNYLVVLVLVLDLVVQKPLGLLFNFIKILDIVLQVLSTYGVDVCLCVLLWDIINFQKQIVVHALQALLARQLKHVWAFR